MARWGALAEGEAPSQREGAAAARRRPCSPQLQYPVVVGTVVVDLEAAWVSNALAPPQVAHVSEVQVMDHQRLNSAQVSGARQQPSPHLPEP